MRYLFACLVLVGCASGPASDGCAALAARGRCNGDCAARYTFTDPAYGACVNACMEMYPSQPLPPGGCDAGPMGDAS